jgi:hypothetical protein
VLTPIVLPIGTHPYQHSLLRLLSVHRPHLKHAGSHASERSAEPRFDWWLNFYKARRPPIKLAVNLIQAPTDRSNFLVSRE